MCKISLDALPIYRQASKQRTKGQGKWPSGQVARGKWCPIGASQLASQDALGLLGHQSF